MALVIISQLNDCLFVCLIFQSVIFMLKHIASSNGGAIITGVLCLAVLIGLKKVNERFKNKLPVPIPAELLVVILSFDCLFYSLSSKGTIKLDTRWSGNGA